MKVPTQQTNITKLLRKASSSQHPSILPALLQSHDCTISDLETPSASDGKNALHMACWMGCIDNISLLLHKGCDVNAISIGRHNYGKSPIFYAITRGREDVVRYLLSCDDCNVRIVNNKGQSVYSLAYSHDFSGDILESIREKEKEGEKLGTTTGLYEGWLDYSASHSDGCIYGDLDLRFLTRPLTDDDVVKDGIVVNPTTKESRRGNFARNNPSTIIANGKASTKSGAVTQKRRQKKQQIKRLSTEQHLQLEQLWSNVGSSIQRSDSWDLFSSLLAIVQFWENSAVRLPWISDSATRLDFIIKFETFKTKLDTPRDMSGAICHSSLLSEAIVFCGGGDRHATLVKRILHKTTDDATIPQPNEQMQRHDSEALLAMHQGRLALLWIEIDKALDSQDPFELYLTLIKSMILCDGRVGNWMKDHSKQLHSMLQSKSIQISDCVMKQVLQHCEISSCRYANLLKRLLTSSMYNDIDVNECSNNMNKAIFSGKKNRHELPTKYKVFLKSLQRGLESNVCSNLLSWDMLMNPYLQSKRENRHISLPQPPTFIDSSPELSRLENKLRGVAASSISASDNDTEEVTVQFNQLIAFDSEFCTNHNGDTEVATVQFSILENGVPFAWVVDLLPKDEDYYSIACDVLRWLFLESNSHIMCFAPRHDLHLLSLYVGEDIQSSSVWDMQLLAAHKMAEDADTAKKNIFGSMPGLKQCCSYSLNGSPWTLSKDEQCSDWSQRRLSADQLEYAGLDAAVLLVLLSELVRRR